MAEDLNSVFFSLTGCQPQLETQSTLLFNSLWKKQNLTVESGHKLAKIIMLINIVQLIVKKKINGNFKK